MNLFKEYQKARNGTLSTDLTVGSRRYYSVNLSKACTLAWHYAGAEIWIVLFQGSHIVQKGVFDHDGNPE